MERLGVVLITVGAQMGAVDPGQLIPLLHTILVLVKVAFPVIPVAERVRVLAQLVLPEALLTPELGVVEVVGAAFVSMLVAAYHACAVVREAVVAVVTLQVVAEQAIPEARQTQLLLTAYP